MYSWNMFSGNCAVPLLETRCGIYNARRSVVSYLLWSDCPYWMSSMRG